MQSTRFVAHLQRGQGMTEYIIIVALIAVSAITVYTGFGRVIRAQTAGLAMEMAGESGKAMIDAAKTGSDKAQQEGQKDRTLKSYENAN